jgi:hypothetical protein
VNIQDVLSRRSDLSTFVVHLTRGEVEMDSEGEEVFLPAAQKLRWIIEDRAIKAFTPMGMATEQDDPNDPAKQTQRVVCFSETPLEHIYSLVAEITTPRRRIQLEPYGLALTKLITRRLGANPIWYVDMLPTGREWLTNEIWKLRDAAVETGAFHEQPIAKLLPFFDWMGGPFPNRPTSKEFWWEREWRHVGDVGLDDVWSKIIWLCPSDEQEAFAERVREATPLGQEPSKAFIDPRWGLEEIVAHLIGLPPEDITVFHASPGHENAIEPPPPPPFF